MKFAVIAAFAAVAVSSCSAADINVMGANNLRTMTDKDVKAMGDAKINVMGASMPMPMQMQSQDANMKSVGVASHSTLNRATGLVNKNTAAMDNNVFIARSNIVFTQNDRMAMRQKVRDVMNTAMKTQQNEQATSTAVLTKNVMRVVSASDTDAALMTKASAVVAAKNADDATLNQRIADFVDAAGKREMETEEEQAIQSQVPRGVTVLIGTKDILRQPTAAVNKNIAASDNQVAISRSNVMPSQNDRVMLGGQAKVADAVLPASAVNVAMKSDAEPQYRVQIAFRKEGDDKKQEQFGLWGAGWGLGWRYPLSYWNTVGFGLYGGGCGLGFPMGGFYYC